MREQVLVPPIVVSSRRSLPQRAPFSFTRRYLSPSRPRLSSRLSFRFSFRRRPALRLVVVLSRFPSRLSSKRSVPRSVLRSSVVSSGRLISSVVPCRLARRFVLLVARRLVPSVVSFLVLFLVSSRRRSVPRLVPSSRPSFIGSSLLPVSSTREAGRFLFSFDSERGEQARERAGGGQAMDWAGQGERGA